MKQKHFYMGAIDKKTNEYVFPLHATKDNEYSCPICKNDIIFKSGKINRKHFSHKKQSNCSYYNNPSESQIHKDAKRLMKKMLDDKQKLMIWRNCKCCGDDIEVLNMVKYNDKMVCREEFSFNHNSNNRIADVVLLDDDNINFIFEIFKTHRTDEINRPSDKWCEIDAEDLIINTMEETNRNDCDEIEIECVRNILCDDCEKNNKIMREMEQHRLKLKEIEKERYRKWRAEWEMGTEEQDRKREREEQEREEREAVERERQDAIWERERIEKERNRKVWADWELGAKEREEKMKNSFWDIKKKEEYKKDWNDWKNREGKYRIK